jgi:hypothetical protein
MIPMNMVSPDLSPADIVLIKGSSDKPIRIQYDWGRRSYWSTEFCGLAGLVLSVQRRPDMDSCRFSTFDPIWMIEILVNDEVFLVEAAWLKKVE